MKKLLLALAVLAGLALPSMAKDCSEYDTYHVSVFELTRLILDDDFECAEYVVKVKKIDLRPSLTDDYSVVFLAAHSEKERSLDILKLLVENGADPTYEIYAWNAVTEAFSQAYYDYATYNDPNTLPVKKFRFLIDYGKNDFWKAIDNEGIKRILQGSLWIRKTSFIKFLLDLGIPVTEYNRYIYYTKELIKVVENEEDLDWEVSNYEDILRNNQAIETGKQIIELFEQRKEAELKKVYDNMGKILDENMEREFQKLSNPGEIGTLHMLDIPITGKLTKLSRRMK